MKLSPDDPKLTAYALGELPPAEAAAVEKEINASPELRVAVEEIRQTTEFLKKEFSLEEAPILTAKQKAAITSEIPPVNIVQLPRYRAAMFVTVSAIAACVMLVLGIGLFGPKDQRSVVSKTFEYKYAQNAIEAEHRDKLQKESAAVSHGTAVNKTPVDEVLTAPNKAIANPQQNGQIVDYVEKPVKSTPTRTLREYGVTKGSDNHLSVEKSWRNESQKPPAPKTISRSQPVAQPLAPEGTRKKVPSAAATPAPTVVTAGKSEQYFWRDNGSQAGEALRLDVAQAHVASRSPAKIVSDRRQREITASDIRLYDGLPSVKEAEADIRGESGSLGWYKTGDTARYPRYVENAFESVRNAPLSTFSVDVDNASYANVRRFLNQNQMPPHDAVRIEEMVNYFTYSYPQPRGDVPFSVNMEVAGCPWNKEHRLVRVGLKGKEIAQDKRPPSNFVFLIDVSGSMSPSERLPLIKQALRMLVKRMTENDRIAMVVYASSSGVVLGSTSCVNKEKILEAIDRLEAGGSTNGGEGIQKAYALAEEHFIKGGVNRVILATDGDFNVGITDQGELVNLIQKKAKSGVFLSALGVGTDNYKDALLQKLADKGNGNYYYLDSLEEAQKVLIQQMNGTLVTIAKDVKIQIEFNPAQVQSYRLIGYEKRILEAEDFNNDKKDAGEIGAGHTVTALYEIVPVGVDEDDTNHRAVDDLKYQPNRSKEIARPTPRRGDWPVATDKDLLTLKLRYKKPDGDKSKLLEFPLIDDGKKFNNASSDFRFATAVAGFGMLLKHSEYRGNFSYDQALEIASAAKGDDKEGYRAEFITLVKKATKLDHSRHKRVSW